MEIDNFNRTIDIWLNELNSYTLNQLLLKPDGKSWSLGQLYNHIVEETNWYNGQILIALTDKENSKVATLERTRILMNRGSFENKLFKGDPSIAENMEQPKSVEDIKLDLEKLKTSTNQLFSKVNKTSINGKSEHPGMGFMNCSEWLRYSEMHMRHHLKQKARIDNFLMNQKIVIN